MKNKRLNRWLIWAALAVVVYEYLAWRERQRKAPAPGSADFIGPVLPNS